MQTDPTFIPQETLESAITKLELKVSEKRKWSSYTEMLRFLKELRAYKEAVEKFANKEQILAAVEERLQHW